MNHLKARLAKRFSPAKGRNPRPPRRTKVFAVLAALALFAAMAVVPSMASAITPTEEGSAGPQFEAGPLLEESCESGNFCVWTKANFQGVRSEQRCTFGVHGFEFKKFSAKNRCPNRRTILHEPAEAYVKCMEHGTSQATPNGFLEVVVGNIGETC